MAVHCSCGAPQSMNNIQCPSWRGKGRRALGGLWNRDDPRCSANNVAAALLEASRAAHAAGGTSEVPRLRLEAWPSFPFDRGIFK